MVALGVCATTRLESGFAGISSRHQALVARVNLAYCRGAGIPCNDTNSTIALGRTRKGPRAWSCCQFSTLEGGSACRALYTLRHPYVLVVVTFLHRQDVRLARPASR